MSPSGDPGLLSGLTRDRREPIVSGSVCQDPWHPRMEMIDTGTTRSDHYCNRIWIPSTAIRLTTSPHCATGVQLATDPWACQAVLSFQCICSLTPTITEWAWLASCFGLRWMQIGSRFGFWPLKLASQPRVKHACRHRSACWDGRYL